MAEKPRPAGATDEPSIEEILGSIRRIIAEDDDTSAPAIEEEEPLELTNKIEPDGMIVQPEPEPVLVAEEPIVEEPQAPAQSISFVEEAAPMPPSIEEDTNEDLISETTADATAAMMAKLARRTPVVEAGNEGVSIEAIVREMLKPMLRDWLDTNLPDIVEKVVEREMERLSKRV